MIETDRCRNPIAFGASFFASLAALWLVTGLGRSEIGEYLGGALEIVSGYSETMRQEALASPEGPELILRQHTFPIDNRHPGFESPAAAPHMPCSFRAVRTTQRWQVLERVSDRRGKPAELETVSGEPLAPDARRSRSWSEASRRGRLGEFLSVPMRPESAGRR